MKRFLAILGSLVLATLLPGQSAALRYNPATKELQDSVVVPAGKTITANGNIVSSTAGDASKFLRGDGSYAAVTTTGSFATAADINAGTATDKAIAPDQLALTSASPAFVNGLLTRTNGKAPARGVYFDGTAGVYGAIPSALLGGSFGLALNRKIPSANPAVIGGLCAVGTAGSGFIYLTSGLFLYEDIDGSLKLLKGTSGGVPAKTLTFASYVASYGGQVANICAKFDGVSTVSIVLNGVTVASDTDVLWAEPVIGTSVYWGVAQNNATRVAVGMLAPIGIFNIAPTAAQIAYIAETGNIPSELLPNLVGQPAGVGLITGDSSTFTGGIGSWSAVNGAAIAATGGKGVITSMGGNFYAGVKIADVVKKGVNYRLALGLSDFVGGTTVKITDSADAVIATADSAFTSLDFTAQNSGALYIVRGGDATTSVSLDNVTLTPLGAEFAMDPQWDGRGYVPNIAGTGNHGILPSSGVYPTNAPSVPSPKATFSTFGIYAPVPPVLSVTLNAGTAYTAGAVIGSVSTTNAGADGLWLLKGGAVNGLYNGGFTGGYLYPSSLALIGSLRKNTSYADVELQISESGGTLTIAVVASNNFTAAGTNTVHVFPICATLAPALVK